MTKQELKEARQALEDGRTNEFEKYLTLAVEALEDMQKALDNAQLRPRNQKSN